MLAHVKCFPLCQRDAAIARINCFTRFALAAAMLLTFTTVSAGARQTVSFTKDIKPIFEKHCLYCHGPEEEEAFRIDDRDDTLNYIIEGEPEESNLYEVLVTDDEDLLMPPPDDDNPLTTEQIRLVKTWIAEGANWPEDGEELETETDESQSAAADENAAAMVADSAVDQKDETDAAAAGDDSITPELLANAGGSLHPAAVHLPIGLLLASGLFALLSLRGNFVMSDCAYYCLWLGALGAIGACVTGWYYSPMEHRGTVNVWADLWDQTQPVFWHRTVGIATSIFALMVALMASSARARDPDDGTLWKLGAIILAGLIGWVGHQGGELTYGKKHYKDLNAVIERLIPGVFPAEQGGAVEENEVENEGEEEVANPTEPENADSGDEKEATGNEDSLE